MHGGSFMKRKAPPVGEKDSLWDATDVASYIWGWATAVPLRKNFALRG